MKHKVCELEGVLLDLAVAKAMGYEFHAVVHEFHGVLPWLLKRPPDPVPRFVGSAESSQGMIWLDEFTQAWRFAPSIAWEHGGPIIEDASINLEKFPGGELYPEWLAFESDGWGEPIEDSPWRQVGPTALVAAMRAFVAAELGEEIDLPE